MYCGDWNRRGILLGTGAHPVAAVPRRHAFLQPWNFTFCFFSLSNYKLILCNCFKMEYKCIKIFNFSSKSMCSMHRVVSYAGTHHSVQVRGCNYWYDFPLHMINTKIRLHTVMFEIHQMYPGAAWPSISGSRSHMGKKTPNLKSPSWYPTFCLL